ncbi:hypothetical protein GB931_18225 [Modestobacter sp. I12A-02628]|uniref:Uncharacterized protein n=1 Tax=Goekera deserti TaxID=2497753 RepID=A0A7K3W826_9ACTN|nr:hypothetical protein [Goekera deserti]MPQ99819.1 hypothetical protein [Goekera deserti]NDI49976.1 hypothetical protein [Goekera deserti]NEL52547.1 hypothetical protein [Goekera deserti]
MRVYLPATTTVLRRLLDDRRLEGPHTGFAVTPDVRSFYDVDADDEELEYAALLAAARSSLRLIDIDPGAVRRRVVLALEVPDGAVEPIGDEDVDRGAARITGDVTIAQVASAHVDLAEAEEDVRAAVAVVLEADLGDEDAQFLVDQAEGHELAWYANQEIGVVLDLL